MSESSPKPPYNHLGPADAATATLRLGHRVQEARQRRKLTQAELAEASGVTDETISRIERGRYEPAVSTLFRLADALNVTMDELVREGDRDRERGSARRPAAAGSPIVRRLRARIDTLTPSAQRALLAIAEVLPEARPRKGPAKDS